MTGIECNVVLILIFVNSETLTSFIRYHITGICYLFYRLSGKKRKYSAFNAQNINSYNRGNRIYRVPARSCPAFKIFRRDQLQGDGAEEFGYFFS